MAYLPVTKHPPVSASAAEAATGFKMLQFTCIGHSVTIVHIFKACSLSINILQRNCLLPFQSDITNQCLRAKSCLKHEIWPLYFDMLPCNTQMCVRFSHLVLWDHLLFPFCIMLLSTCCITPSYNKIIFLLCVQLVLLNLLVVLVTYREVSFSEHLHHMSALALYMVDAVNF